MGIAHPPYAEHVWSIRCLHCRCEDNVGLTSVCVCLCGLQMCLCRRYCAFEEECTSDGPHVKIDLANRTRAATAESTCCFDQTSPTNSVIVTSFQHEYYLVIPCEHIFLSLPWIVPTKHRHLSEMRHAQMELVNFGSTRRRDGSCSLMASTSVWTSTRNFTSIVFNKAES